MCCTESHRENYYTILLEGLIPPGLQIKNRPTINAISHALERHWNFVLYDAEKKIGPVVIKRIYLKVLSAKLKHKSR